MVKETNMKVPTVSAELWVGKDGILNIKIVLDKETMSKYRNVLEKSDLPVFVDFRQFGEEYPEIEEGEYHV